MNAILSSGKAVVRNFDYGYLLRFLVLLLLFRYGNLGFEGIIDPPGLAYSPFLDHHLNYIDWIKSFLLHTSTAAVRLFGVDASVQGLRKILLPGNPSLILGMPCVGLAMLSFWAAFILAHRYGWKQKVLWTVGGMVAITLINCLRIILMALAIAKDWNFNRYMNHHDTFKLFAYSLIALMVVTFYHQYKKEKNTTA